MKKSFITLLIAGIFITSISLQTAIAQSWNITGNNDATSSSKLGTVNNVPLKFYTKNTQRMVIDSVGRVGIGISSPVNIFTLKLNGSNPASSWLGGGSSPAFMAFGENLATGFNLATAADAPGNRPVLNTRRSRGTLASPAVVQNNDYLASFVSSGYDGSDFQNPAAIDFYVDGTPSPGNVPGRISFVTGSNASNRVERLKIGNTGNFNFNNGQLFLQQSNGSVGIGTVAPDASSLLEVKSATKGLLTPRMTRAQRDAILSPATGLLIYQTNNTPGFYYYDGSAWSPVKPGTGAGSGWSLTGNAGTDPSTNFIGTTDAQPLLFKVDNVKAGLIDNTPNGNAAFGYQSLPANTSGFYNSAFGYGSLKANTTGDRNTGIGLYALTANNADNNTAIGTYALSANTGGQANMAAGVNALSSNTTGDFNTATGTNALYTNLTGTENTANGYAALFSNLTGNDNTAFGKFTLYNNLNASLNTALGFNALFFNTDGASNTATGSTALQNNTLGSNNVAAGFYALGTNITGNNNTAIGFAADVSTTNLTNATAIGANTKVDASNSLILGNNANVGIGTSSPGAPLHIVSSISNNSLKVTTSGASNDPSILLARNSGASDKFQMNVRGSNGNSWLSIWDATNGSVDNGINIKGNNVGIGTPSPGYQLDVAGRMRIRTGNGTAGTWFMNAANTTDAAFVGMLSDKYVGLYGTGVGWGLIMNTASGNVGMGTFNPAYKLDVCGTIRSKELRVESGWCDYVFDKDYKLKSLDELEQFINDNKHLPGIAPAAEVEKEGLKVGEMNKAMMEKIEELTLYVIQLSKENRKLQHEIDSLKK